MTRQMERSFVFTYKNGKRFHTGIEKRREQKFIVCKDLFCPWATTRQDDAAYPSLLEAAYLRRVNSLRCVGTGRLGMQSDSLSA